MALENHFCKVLQMCLMLIGQVLTGTLFQDTRQGLPISEASSPGSLEWSHNISIRCHKCCSLANAVVLLVCKIVSGHQE